MARGLLFNGDYAYMGASDTGLIQMGLDLYGRDIGIFLWQSLARNTVISLFLSLPFMPVYLRLRERRPRVAFGFVWLVTALVFSVWIAISAIRIPSLFSEIYYGDGTMLSSRFFGYLCSSLGLGALIVLGLAVLAFLARAGSLRVAGSAALWYALLGGLLWWGERMPTSISLPKSSVVVLMADSFRFDYFAQDLSPEIFERYARFSGPKFVANQVVPPLPRTAPSVTALLTGKLPIESGVTEMFSQESSFDQTDSIVSAYRKAGYCTLVVGDYPAEFFRKLNFGFDYRDVPLARFREIFMQAILKKSPFTLATLSWTRLQLSADAKDIMVALPEYAAPGALGLRLKRLARKCGEKPVFAFVFADQPHFPYVQTWPHYLALDKDYWGPYKFLKDAVSAPKTTADKDRVRALYQTGMRSSDRAFAGIVDALEVSGTLPDATVVVTGDHGECLYDGLNIMGHGDQIGDMYGVAVPWIAFGAEPGTLANHLEKPLSLLHMSQWLPAIRGIKAPRPSPLGLDEVYVETGLWMAETPNVPKDRIRYPDLSQLLEIKSRDGHMVMKDRYTGIVEYAKRRAWILEGVRYDAEPLPDRIRFMKDGREISATELDPRIKTFLNKYYRDIANTIALN